MKNLLAALALSALVALSANVAVASVYELRVYEAVPGRLGDLNKRFETLTIKLWEKHGIRPVGF